MSGEDFAKNEGNCKDFGNLMDEDLENVVDLDCLKIRDLVGPKAEAEKWVCTSYLFSHKTILLCAEHKANLFDNRTTQRLKLKFLY